MPVGDAYEDVPLVDPLDLFAFPGAPHDAGLVRAAARTVRDVAGWHIAPQVTETLTLDARGGRLLVLPTLHLVAVTEIRDVTDPDAPKVLDGWRKTKSGMLHRSAGWPCGFETVEVDLKHGYEVCPSSLLAPIAELTQMMRISGAVSQETSGQESVTYRATATRSGVVRQYTIRSAA